MDTNREWTTFAVDAEVHEFGTSRLCKAHNKLRSELSAIEREVEALRKAVAVKDEAMVAIGNLVETVRANLRSPSMDGHTDRKARKAIEQAHRLLPAALSSTPSGMVPCPVCKRGDIWQEAVNRTEYVYRNEAVDDGQDVIDYLLAEVRSMLEQAEDNADRRRR